MTKTIKHAGERRSLLAQIPEDHFIEPTPITIDGTTRLLRDPIPDATLDDWRRALVAAHAEWIADFDPEAPGPDDVSREQSIGARAVAIMARGRPLLVPVELGAWFAELLRVSDSSGHLPSDPDFKLASVLG
jgi:hypothetical protein